MHVCYILLIRYMYTRILKYTFIHPKTAILVAMLCIRTSRDDKGLNTHCCMPLGAVYSTLLRFFLVFESDVCIWCVVASVFELYSSIQIVLIYLYTLHTLPTATHTAIRSSLQLTILAKFDILYVGACTIFTMLCFPYTHNVAAGMRASPVCFRHIWCGDESVFA